MSNRIFRASRFGKFMERFTEFIRECKNGVSCFYSAPDYICMDRKSYKSLELALSQKTEALWEYGDHLNSCITRDYPRTATCNCGWIEVLKGLDDAKKGTR